MLQRNISNPFLRPITGGVVSCETFDNEKLFSHQEADINAVKVIFNIK